MADDPTARRIACERLAHHSAMLTRNATMLETADRYKMTPDLFIEFVETHLAACNDAMALYRGSRQ